MPFRKISIENVKEREKPARRTPLAYSAVCAVVTVCLAFSLFKKLEPAFAESI